MVRWYFGLKGRSLSGSVVFQSPEFSNGTTVPSVAGVLGESSFSDAEAVCFLRDAKDH